MSHCYTRYRSEEISPSQGHWLPWTLANVLGVHQFLFVELVLANCVSSTEHPLFSRTQEWVRHWTHIKVGWWWFGDAQRLSTNRCLSIVNKQFYLIDIFFAKNMISMNGLKLREAEQEAIILDRSICTRQPTPLKGLEYSQTPKLTRNEYSMWHYPYNAIQCHPPRTAPDLPVTAGVGLGFWVVPSSHKTEFLCHFCGKGFSGVLSEI